MIILSLDSSSVSASVAITEDTTLLGEYTISSALKHSETLLPMAKSLLTSCGKTLQDVDLFAVNAGPGSFTGVRIGVCLVKGLTFGTGKPIASVSSIEALAYNMQECDKLVVPVMDARRGQFYTALFYNGQRLTDDSIITSDELTSLIEDKLGEIGDVGTVFVGDGAKLAMELIDLQHKSIADGHRVVSSAYSTAVIAYRNYQIGKDIMDDRTISPIYLRLSQAERERNERLEREKQNEQD